MTAFSRREVRSEFGVLIWELRSVNHRFLDISLRLPEELRVLEPDVRECVSKRLSRGKVDCSLQYVTNTDKNVRARVNAHLAQQIISASAEMEHILHESVPPRTMDILRWPGVLELEEQDFTSTRLTAIELLNEALDELVLVRKREGEQLAELVMQRCAAMRVAVERVKTLMPGVLDAVRSRLLARLREVSEDLDQERLEQEMVLMAQRLDVDEEMDRLNTHIDEIKRVLMRDEPVGRRLDFLMQELNREANTLASKSNNIEITGIAVELKVLIEQMREQVQNIE